jgi:hypothetical protein
MLINPDSELSSVYSDVEKKELIYHLFRLFVLGGPMAQADIKIDRYLNLTKSVYKELLTVYKDSTTNKISTANRIYLVNCIDGIELHPHPASPLNFLLVNIDSVKKCVIVMKHSFVPFW